MRQNVAPATIDFYRKAASGYDFQSLSRSHLVVCLLRVALLDSYTGFSIYFRCFALTFKLYDNKI